MGNMKKSLNNEKKFYFAMLKNISYKLTTVLVLSQVCFADASRPWQMDFQDPATPIMEGIINFHNHIMFFITVIVVFVSWLMGRCIYQSRKMDTLHGFRNCLDNNSCCHPNVNCD